MFGETFGIFAILSDITTLIICFKWQSQFLFPISKKTHKISIVFVFNELVQFLRVNLQMMCSNYIYSSKCYATLHHQLSWVRLERLDFKNHTHTSLFGNLIDHYGPSIVKTLTKHSSAPYHVDKILNNPKWDGFFNLGISWLAYELCRFLVTI